MVVPPGCSDCAREARWCARERRIVKPEFDDAKHGSSLSANQIKGLDVQQVDELLPNGDLGLAVKSNLSVLCSADEHTLIFTASLHWRRGSPPCRRGLLFVSEAGTALTDFNREYINKIIAEEEK